MRWRERIIHSLNGQAFGVPRERLGWNGYMSVYNLFIEARQEQQDEIIDAMLQIINDAKNSKDEEPWLLAADVIHLVYSLKIEDKRFEETANQIDIQTAPTEHSRNAMQYALDTYNHTPYSVDRITPKGIIGRVSMPKEQEKSSKSRKLQ